MGLSSFSVILRRVIDCLQLTIIGFVKPFPLEMDCWWCKELNHLVITVNRISGFKAEWDEMLMNNHAG
jgi:hypothetical protein